MSDIVKSLSDQIFTNGIAIVLEPFLREGAVFVEDKGLDGAAYRLWKARVDGVSLSFLARIDGKGLSKLTIAEGDRSLAEAQISDGQGVIDLWIDGRRAGSRSLSQSVDPVLVPWFKELELQARNQEGGTFTFPGKSAWIMRNQSYGFDIGGYRVLSVVPKDQDYMIEIVPNSWFVRAVNWALGLLGLDTPARAKSYLGNVTVWNDARTGRRANTRMEGLLCDALFFHKKIGGNAA